MTTDFYETENRGQIYIENLVREQSWLIDEVIIKKLPSMVSTIKSIIFYLILDKPFRLPITSNNSDAIKGIMSRNSYRVTDVVLNLKRHSSFTHHTEMRLQRGSVIELSQIKSVLRKFKLLLLQLVSLFDTVAQRHKLAAGSHFAVLENNVRFLKSLYSVTQNIVAIHALLVTPDQTQIFPEAHLQPDLFEPPLNLEKHSLDLYLNAGEIFMELFDLKKITVKPWCFINSHGVSFNEFVTRKVINKHTASKFNNMDHLIEYYVQESHWEEFFNYKLPLSHKSSLESLRSPTSATTPTRVTSISHSRAGSINESSSAGIRSFDSKEHWFKNMFSSSETNQLYLNKNIKFNNAIYWLTKSHYVKVSDPILLIVNIKMNSLKNELNNHLTNLKNLIVNRDFLDYVFGHNDNECGSIIRQLFDTHTVLEPDENIGLDLLKNSDIERKLSTESATYESFDNLEVNFDNIEELKLDFAEAEFLVDDWNGQLVKEVSNLLNNNDDAHSCQFDVFDIKN